MADAPVAEAPARAERLVGDLRRAMDSKAVAA